MLSNVIKGIAQIYIVFLKFKTIVLILRLDLFKYLTCNNVLLIFYLW